MQPPWGLAGRQELTRRPGVGRLLGGAAGGGHGRGLLLRGSLLRSGGCGLAACGGAGGALGLGGLGHGDGGDGLALALVLELLAPVVLAGLVVLNLEGVGVGGDIVKSEGEGSAGGIA